MNFSSFLIKSIALPLMMLVSCIMIAQPDADKPSNYKDVVTFDDVIINGSSCVGIDCFNGENFGFDTQRYKENNLRIHFDDTSVTASFPSNDWRIQINDSNNGGRNYFAVQDATANYIPFYISAGAGADALFINNNGNVGLGTGLPATSLHITESNTPAMRLEQDNSESFPAQTWDVGGNEFNFFVKDVTGGDMLPFRIRPGAPTSSLDINSNGNVGIGTNDADADLVVADGTTFSKVNAGETGFTVTSSRDLKTNIQDVQVDNILHRIAKVPVTTYDWKTSALKSGAAPRGDVMGLIAEDFHTVFGRGEDNTIRSQEIQMALWLAVQELHEDAEEKSSIIDQQQTQIATLLSELQSMKELLSDKVNQSVEIGGVSLKQNTPNPFSDQTNISYNIPASAATASMVIYDLNGNLLKEVVISELGTGAVNLNTSELPSGTYTYSLIVDGVRQGSERMVKQ